jgi:hypothetical protein
VVIIAPAEKNTSATGHNNIAVNLDGAQSSFMSFTNGSQVAADLTHSVACGVISPASGSHTVNVKFWVDSGTGTLLSGTSLTNSKILVYIQKLG